MHGKLTYAQAIALTELIIYIILDFAEWTVPTLISSVYPVAYRVKYHLVEIFLYKSPYKRLELFAESVRKALLASGHLQTQNCKARVVRSDKNSIHTATYLRVEPCAKKKFLHRRYRNSLLNRESALYSKSYDLIDQMTKYFAVPSMFDKRKEDVIVFVANIEKYIGSYEIIYTRNVEGRHILLDARLNALGNKQERTFSKKKVTSKLNNS